MQQIVLASKVSVNRKTIRKIIRKVTMNQPSTFFRSGRLMRAGKMPRSLMRWLVVSGEKDSPESEVRSPESKEQRLGVGDRSA